MNAKDKSLYRLHCKIGPSILPVAIINYGNHFVLPLNANDRCTLKPIVHQCLAYCFVLAVSYPKTKIGELPSTILVNLTKLSHTHTHTHTHTINFQLNLQKRACPQLAKANLGGPCLNSRIKKIYEKQKLTVQIRTD